MAYVNFEIPANKNELYSTGDNYCVKNDIGPKELPSALKSARTALREEGAEYITENFDIYYSILHHVDTLTMDVIHKAYEDLHKASLELNKSLGFLLEDKDSLNEELRLKYQNVMKMIIYLYTEIIISIEQRHMAKDDQLVKGRKKSNKDQDDFTVDKKSSLLILNNIIQRDISLFWDPPIVEEKFINRICAVCYEFLEKPSIKSCKDELCEIFSLFGYLLKSYNYGSSFVVRVTQLVKMHEHLGQCLPKGIQQIVQEFNCKGLLHELIEELTEWQVDDKHNDAQGSRFCSLLLSSLAALMPDLMIPEITSLNVYLHYEPPTLRNSVLIVMVEVILNNLTSHTLSEEQKEFRDRLFNILMEHVNDNAVLVRSKVLGQMARLQKENAIPLKFQLQILGLAVEHLHDKGVLVRKNAVNCVTTFLAYNAYSASLSLAVVQEKLNAKSKELKIYKQQLGDPKVEELIALQSKWDSIVDKLQNFVENEINNEDKENQEENGNNIIDAEEVSKMLKNLLGEHKFKEAFQLCKTTLQKSTFFEGLSEGKRASDDSSLYMTIFYTCFFDVNKVMKQIDNREFRTITPEDYKKFEILTKEETFLKDCVNFLKHIDHAIDLMVDLLESTSITDMHEAIEFFVAAYQFQIDRAETGILAMLRLMQRNEQERKDAVIEAFKTIFLKTEANNLMDHCTTIINRLIKLLKSVPVNNIDDLEEIISNWCSKGILDNAVIDKLWRYVTQQLPITPEDECAAMEILRMCAIGRKTIVKSNLNLVLSIASSDRAKTNMVFFGACCKMLAVAYEKVDVNSAKPPFRLKADDDAFKNVLDILQENFFEPVEFLSRGLYGAIDFIYKLCKKPETVCETLLNYVYSTLYKKQQKEENIPDYILIRVCQLCGYLALKQLEFMDDSLYKELKRRQNLRDEREKGKKKTQKNSSRLNATDMSVAAEKTILEGAQAEDTDADFILNVLENDTVTGSGGLAKLSPWIVTVCERPAIFIGKELQACAITALMRYMLVSSKFCSQHIRLIFTIFSKTNYPEVKKNILVHLYDMLIRFPNIVEPWTPKIFENLNEPSVEIRRPTFFILTSLILRDLIRAHSHIPEMALCLVDEDEVLRGMCRTFFIKLAHKENNLYNALPDIYTHVLLQEKINDEGVQGIMSFLFEQIENAKHMESLVDRFCSKFQLTDDIRQQRNTSYCLTLIKYNEKALKKLIDNFPMYKHILHDEQIYSNFRTVMQNCCKTQVGKADLKTVVAELENLVKSVFELDNNGLMPAPIIPPKSAKKPRKMKKVISKKLTNSDDDEDANESTPNTDCTSVKRSTRIRKRTVVTDDSD